MTVQSHHTIHGVEIFCKADLTPGTPDPDYTEGDFEVFEAEINGMDGMDFLRSWTFTHPKYKKQTNALSLLEEMALEYS